MGDLDSRQLLNWFLDEQVEEEANVSGVIDQLKLVGPTFHERGLEDPEHHWDFRKIQSYLSEFDLWWDPEDLLILEWSAASFFASIPDQARFSARRPPVMSVCGREGSSFATMRRKDDDLGKPRSSR